MEYDDILTSEQAAEQLGFSRQWLQVLVKQGRIRKLQHAGRQVLIRYIDCVKPPSLTPGRGKEKRDGKPKRRRKRN